MLASKAGKVRLLKPAELPEDWDPTTDKRLTVWEMEMSEENDIPGEQAKDIGCDVAQVYNGRRRLKGHVDAVGKLMEEW